MQCAAQVQPGTFPVDEVAPDGDVTIGRSGAPTLIASDRNALNPSVSPGTNFTMFTDLHLDCRATP